MTSTIQIAISGINEPWDTSRIDVIIDEIEAALREEAGVYTTVNADSMTISLAVETTQLPEAAKVLRDLGVI